jgi:hypothetical protein
MLLLLSNFDTTLLCPELAEAKISQSDINIYGTTKASVSEYVLQFLCSTDLK